ncbi:hypothetical protein ACT3UJ_06400 [Halomonas sp. 86]|uniref:hypothetical protein n=1 Tax=unclassified Halomonas TaxID=2609666 RepID=UPI0040333B89
MSMMMKMSVEVTEVRVFKRVIELEHSEAVNLTFRETEDELGALMEGLEPTSTQWVTGTVSEASSTVPVSPTPEIEAGLSATEKSACRELIDLWNTGILPQDGVLKSMAGPHDDVRTAERDLMERLIRKMANAL